MSGASTVVDGTQEELVGAMHCCLAEGGGGRGGVGHPSGHPCHGIQGDCLACMASVIWLSRTRVLCYRFVATHKQVHTGMCLGPLAGNCGGGCTIGRMDSCRRRFLATIVHGQGPGVAPGQGRMYALHADVGLWSCTVASLGPSLIKYWPCLKYSA